MFYLELFLGLELILKKNKNNNGNRFVVLDFFSLFP